MPPPLWRLLLSPPATGAENMALDEALMERARETDEWVLRVYTWRRPTISLGRNQTAHGRYDLDRIRQRGYDVVRRPTGGRAILHHREITYSVTAPVAGAGDLQESYERINRLLLAALGSMGVAAEVAAPRGHAMAPGATPCFHEPSAGELILGGRKLAGSAQWRAEGSLLQHGSILVRDDQSALAELTVPPTPDIPPPATLSEALDREPTAAEVAEALARAIELMEGVAPAPLNVCDQLRARADALVVRYLDSAWTWRR